MAPENFRQQAVCHDYAVLPNCSCRLNQSNKNSGTDIRISACMVFSGDCIVCGIMYAGGDTDRLTPNMPAGNYGAVVFAVFINGFVAFSKLVMINRHRTEFRNMIIEVGKVAAPGYVVVGSWTNCILLDHYLSQKSYTPCYWIDNQDLSGAGGELKQVEAFKKLREAVVARRQIWLSRDHAVFFSVLQRNGYEITPYRDMYVATAKN